MASWNFITIGGLTLAVLGIVMSIYYGRRALGQSKRELRWSTEAIPLLSSDVESYRSVVRIIIKGRDMINPYLIRLQIKNTGKVDIESTMFDQGRPLVFELTKQEFFHVIESGSPATKATECTIKVGPELLPSGESWICSFIAEGRAEVSLAENYLPNVNIRDITPRSRENAVDFHIFYMTMRLSLITALVAVTLTVAALILNIVTGL